MVGLAMNCWGGGGGKIVVTSVHFFSRGPEVWRPFLCARNNLTVLNY